MRTTLEQLKAMNDEQLHKHWIDGCFPFDAIAGCGHCLMQHHGAYTARCKQHTDVTREVGIVPFTGPMKQVMRPHLEALYAMRLFFDSLYPQAVGAAPQTEQAVAENVVHVEVGEKRA